MTERSASRRALFLAAGVLGLGLVWTYPDLITRFGSGAPAQMASGCEPSRTPCSARFTDGAEAILAVETSSVPDRPHHLVLRTKDWAPESIGLSGVSMNMGYFRAPLTESGDHWTTDVVLPACHSPVMRWKAVVEGEGRFAEFEFDVAKAP